MQIQNINLPNHISHTSAPQKDITNLVLNNDHQRLTIKEGVSYTFLPINQIIFIAPDSNYSTLYLVNGKKIMTSKTLKE